MKKIINKPIAETFGWLHAGGTAVDLPEEPEKIRYVLAPGETREVTLTIDPRMLCSWDPALSYQLRSDGTKDKWMRPAGAREIMVGASSADIRLKAVCG